MITRVQELGYRLKILSSATLISPAFNQNVFASVEDLQLKTPGEYPGTGIFALRKTGWPFWKKGAKPVAPVPSSAFCSTIPPQSPGS